MTIVWDHCEGDYCVGGGGIAANSSNLMLIENNARFGNNAMHGAAEIDITQCNLTSSGSIHLINNTSTGYFDDKYGPPVAVWASASSLEPQLL